MLLYLEEFRYQFVVVLKSVNNIPGCMYIMSAEESAMYRLH